LNDVGASLILERAAAVLRHAGEFGQSVIDEPLLALYLTDAVDDLASVIEHEFDGEQAPEIEVRASLLDQVHLALSKSYRGHDTSSLMLNRMIMWKRANRR